MAAGVTWKPKRKAGAFSGGDLASGEVGLDTANGVWYYSSDGSTVTALGGGGGGGPTISLLASDFEDSTATLDDVPGFSFSAAANTDYVCEWEFVWSSTNATYGYIFDITGPASPTLVLYSTPFNYGGYITSRLAIGATAGICHASAFGTEMTMQVGSNGSMTGKIALTLKNGANAGTVSLRMATETASGGDFTLFAGSRQTLTTL